MDALRNVSNENANIAFMSISQILDYFNFLHFPNIQILKTKQYIQAMPFCMYFRKHSFLEKSFNSQLNLYSSSGFIVQWAKNFRKQSFKSDRTEPKPLKLDQIEGVLVVCMFMTAASVIVFIFELMSNCHGSIKKITDFFTFKSSPNLRCKFPAFHGNYDCKRQSVKTRRLNIA